MGPNSNGQNSPGARNAQGTYWLLVEDDARVSTSIARLLSQFAPVRHAQSVQDALDLLCSSDRFCGVVLDINLPDGSGLDVLEDMRRKGISVPALVVTAYCEHQNISRAQLLGAQFLWKPWDPENVKAFARKTLRPDFQQEFEQRVQRYRVDHGLSPRESELVRHATAGCALKDLPERMRISRNSVKTLVRRILSKVNAASMQDVTRALHQQIMGAPASGNDTQRNDT